MDILVSYDRYTLEEILIYDSSAYPISGVNVTDINQTRFRFATVNTVDNAGTATTLLAWNEYLLQGSGSIVVNGTTYSAGETVIFANDVTPTIPDGLTIVATGYYSPYSSFLPYVAPYYASFSPTLTGLTGTTFEDSVMNISYDVYNTSHSTGLVVVASLTRFIVKGTENDSITIGGQTFYTGEEFTKSTNFTFAQSVGNVGTCTVVEYFDTADIYTWTDLQAYGTYQEYVQALAQGKCGCDSAFVGRYLKVYSLLNSLYLSAERGVDIDTEAMQAALDQINDLYSQQPIC